MTKKPFLEFAKLKVLLIYSRQSISTTLQIKLAKSPTPINNVALNCLHLFDTGHFPGNRKGSRKHFANVHIVAQFFGFKVNAMNPFGFFALVYFADYPLVDIVNAKNNLTFFGDRIQESCFVAKWVWIILFKEKTFGQVWAVFDTYS